jgi:hypothetical protein
MVFSSRLCTRIAVFLIHPNHDSRHLWAPYDGWEHSPWSIISCKTSLAHTAAVVDDKSCNFLVTHDEELVRALTGLRYDV